MHQLRILKSGETIEVPETTDPIATAYQAVEDAYFLRANRLLDDLKAYVAGMEPLSIGSAVDVYPIELFVEKHKVIHAESRKALRSLLEASGSYQ